MAPKISSGAILITEHGAPGETRTHNPWVRSPVLYPLSYRRIYRVNRVELLLGRATGFEPVISCATDRRLRPLGYARHDGFINDPAGKSRPAVALRGVWPGQTQLQRGLNMLANGPASYKEPALAPTDRPGGFPAEFQRVPVSPIVIAAPG